MTALPEPWRLLTIADYLALDEDELVRRELQEGVLAISPSLKPRHNVAGMRLSSQVDAQLPAHLVAFRLTEELGYADDGEVTGTFTTSSPCPLTIDLKQLG
ncbi:hypothetical protein F5X71_32350 [Nocardia brasiliensis]|uniref:Uncharacterized protein n=1 Tax=Nocardia brasiliensis TaxID=37326 RepID=A0A6G9XZU5_NOCBR|nr:hypothetical protein [Nocardia brasiliensis]QIS06380.1 hypothetical protein F5X71_32350 [Nocardia brasiliensis]